MSQEAPRAPSRTAILTAAARALHREEPPPWVLDDGLALALAGDEGQRMAARLRADLPPPALLGFTRWTCVRARYVEDAVARAASEGVRQYVVLGAGLDSFAYRHGDLLERVRVFEVDHSASQAWKRARLSELGVPVRAGLTFVPADFEHQALRDALVAGGVDPSVPAVFSWIGVTMYLTPEAIRATLATLAGWAPGSRVLLTYNRPHTNLGQLGRDTDGAIGRIAGEVGEPMITLLEPEQVAALLTDLGFADVEDFGPDEAVRAYFPGRTDVRFGGAQRIAAARVPAPHA